MPTWQNCSVPGQRRTSVPTARRRGAGADALGWPRVGRWTSSPCLRWYHRSQSNDLRKTARSRRIELFKALALMRWTGCPGDPRFGVRSTAASACACLKPPREKPYWIGRPIELCGLVPAWNSTSSADVATEARYLAAKPRDQVPVFYHPDDAQDLRERQERQLLRLQDASRADPASCWWRSSPSRNGAVDDTTVSHVIESAIRSGHEPDWLDVTQRQRDGVGEYRRAIGAKRRALPAAWGCWACRRRGRTIAFVSWRASTPIVKGFAVRPDSYSRYVRRALCWWAPSTMRPPSPNCRARFSVCGRCLACGEGRLRHRQCHNAMPSDIPPLRLPQRKPMVRGCPPQYV